VEGKKRQIDESERLFERKKQAVHPLKIESLFERTRVERPFIL
jgi:hypothetical protein